MPHPVAQIAQHIASGGRIPPRIIDALITSKHYLRPGQNSPDPSGPTPKGKAGQKGQAALLAKNLTGARP